MERPEITKIVRNEKDEIIIFETIKKAKKIGGGCHVVLPKDLQGKMVRIIYEKKNDRRGKRNNG